MTDNDTRHVVDMPDTETYHRPSDHGVLRAACNPTARGNLTREADAADRHDACQHAACFGGGSGDGDGDGDGGDE